MIATFCLIIIIIIFYKKWSVFWQRIHNTSCKLISAIFIILYSLCIQCFAFLKPSFFAVLCVKISLGINDLLPYPIFCSEQSAKVDLPRWCGEKVDQLNIMATFNLSNNGAIFVKEGLGICLTFNRLIETTADSILCFRPIIPELHTKMYVIWKKYQVFTPVSQLLLDELKTVMNKHVCE